MSWLDGRVRAIRRLAPLTAPPARLAPTALLVAGILLAASAFRPVVAQEFARDLGRSSAVLWVPYVSWTLPYIDAPGNPFAVEATVVFTHPASGEKRVTQMFYAGDDAWGFRFTGTSTGTWRFASTSDHPALDGWHGEVSVAPNPDPAARGFLTTLGTRFAEPHGEEGRLRTRLYHVYHDPEIGSHLNDFPTDTIELRQAIDVALDEVEAHGFDAAFLFIGHNWLSFGNLNDAGHASENPSLESFAVLEPLILRAHERGLGVHLWVWGDEEARRTPLGIGGINGEVDRRLQRYIAARLGALPGWTMSYGYDLEEWVTPQEVRSWWAYLHAHLGWPHLLMARESDTRAPRLVFDFGDVDLDVASNDDRPTDDYFDSAVAQLASADVPVMFERRFLHMRDDVWNMDVTRRALWQLTLAGGAGAVWGVLFDDGPPYPEPAQLRTHQRFWRDRFTLDLDLPGRLPGVDGAYTLRDGAGHRAVFYAEATASVPLALSGMHEPLRGVAVDASSAYHEIDLGELSAVDQVWTAPYASDWAVAVGEF